MTPSSRYFKCIIYFFLFTICAVSQVTATENKDPFQVRAQTKNGNAITLSNVQAVHGVQIGTVAKTVGHDSSSRDIRRKLFSYTNATTIPLKTGHGFGIAFDLGEMKDGDALEFEIRIISPVPVNGKNFTTGTVRFESAESNKPGYIIEDFRTEDPEYQMPGLWGFQIIQKGKIIFATSFTVVK